jgi:type I restriction enzyme, S subunit
VSWTDGELGDFLTLKRGHDLPNGNRKAGEIPVVSSSGVTGWHNERKAEPPGVVTGRYGTIGEVFYVDKPYWPLNTALYVIDFKGNDPRFVAYLLREKLKNYQSDKAAVPGVDRKVLHKLPARCPDTQIQQAIVRTISPYDNLIENNRQRIALLEETARQLYKEWFVRFRFPGHEHVGIIDGVPEGWKRCPFPEIVDFKEGPGLRNYQYRDEGIPFLNIRTLVNGDVDLTKTQFLDPNEVETKYRHFLVEENDHVVSSSGTLGRVATVRKCHLPLCLNTSIIRMRPRARIGVWHLRAYLSHGDFLDQATARATGAAQLNFGPSHLRQMDILIPTDNLAALAENELTPIYEQIKVLHDLNLNLTKARDLLLPKLMSGAIAV